MAKLLVEVTLNVEFLTDEVTLLIDPTDDVVGTVLGIPKLGLLVIVCF